MDKTKNRQNYDQQLLFPSVLRVAKKKEEEKGRKKIRKEIGLKKCIRIIWGFVG